MRIKRFSLKVKNRKIEGELRLPPFSKRPLFGKYPVVVFSHGFYGTRHGTRGDMFMPMVSVLLKKGIACILFDYSGCGPSKYPYWKTSIGTEAEELDAVIGWSHRQRNLNKYKTGLVTHSLGGPVALTRGAEGIGAMAIIASTNDPYTRLVARIRKKGVFNPKGISSYGSLSVPGERREIGLKFLKDARNYDYRKSISSFHCPALFIHGTKDHMVPIEDSKMLFAHANSPKQLCLIEGASHGFENAKHARHLSAAVSNWFSRYFLQRSVEVVNVVVVRKDKILVLRRGNKVGFYRNMWATVAGHVDYGKTPVEQAYEELEEEIGFSKKDVELVAAKRPIYAPDLKMGKVWKINVVLFEARKEKVKLDWEHTAYAWVTAKRMARMKTFPCLNQVFRYAVKGTSVENDF